MKKLLLLLFVVVLTLIPFFKPGLFDVHDPTSAFRLSTLSQTILSGQFPAAWNNYLNFGFGYPLHLYYAPLFTYLSAVFLPLLSSYEIAIKLALFVASLIGTTGVYFLLRRFGMYPAILSAVAFTYLPYRAGALYVRGSYSEFLAMSLIPWVLYLWSRSQDKIKTILATATVTALFVLSHNTLPVLVMPVVLLMIVMFQFKYLKGSLLALALTFGLTAWFVLPVFFERSFVQVDAVARLTNFKDHFLAAQQLWYSPWGYGGSAAGVGDDHMSFMVGKGQLVLAVLGLAYLLWKKHWKYLTLFGVITATSAFLTLSVSQFIWENVSYLSIMQFPWRSLAFLGVGVSAMAGLSLNLLPKKWQLPSVIVAAVLLIYTNYSYFRPQEYRQYNHDIVTSADNLGPLVKNKIPEYLPHWMPSFPLHAVDDGFSRNATSVSGRVHFNEAAPIVIFTAYMPQWELTVNGQLEPVIPSPNGTIMTEKFLEPGTYEFKLTWHRTTLETVANLITVITMISMIGLLII